MQQAATQITQFYIVMYDQYYKRIKSIVIIDVSHEDLLNSLIADFIVMRCGCLSKNTDVDKSWFKCIVCKQKKYCEYLGLLLEKH
jgi:hypothetical protein